jgi:hypothetical protein
MLAVGMLAAGGCRSVARPPTQAQTKVESTPQIAADLARIALRETVRPGAGSRQGIPDFLTWATKNRLNCSSSDSKEPPAPRSPDLFGNTFLFNDKASARLCETVTGDQTSPNLAGAYDWWRNSQADVRFKPFPTDSRLAATFWAIVKQTTDPKNGRNLKLPSPAEDGTLIPRDVLVRTQNLRASSGACQGSQVAGQTDGEPVEAEKFFFVRVDAEDQREIGSTYGVKCGDLFVLLGFHLVHKTDRGWLWSTFWWDDKSSRRVQGLEGASEGGRYPGAWGNYGMFASLGDENPLIFNPRVSAVEQGKTCQKCHTDGTSVSKPGSTSAMDFDAVFRAKTRFLE